MEYPCRFLFACFLEEFMFKKILAVILSACLLFGVFTGCSSSDEEEGQEFTATDLLESCTKCGNGFFEGFKNRSSRDMANYVYGDTATAFVTTCDDFFTQLDKKVWLEAFYEKFLKGSQVIAGTMISDNNEVYVDYSVVISDYSSSYRNWLLLYKVRLYFAFDDDYTAYVINPEAIFEVYKNMTNDYTTHVAASLLNVNEDFDISNYYYGEELNIYVPKKSYEDRVTENSNTNPTDSSTTETTSPSQTKEPEPSDDDSGL